MEGMHPPCDTVLLNGCSAEDDDTWPYYYYYHEPGEQVISIGCEDSSCFSEGSEMDSGLDTAMRYIPSVTDGATALPEDGPRNVQETRSGPGVKQQPAVYQPPAWDSAACYGDLLDGNGCVNYDDDDYKYSCNAQRVVAVAAVAAVACEAPTPTLPSSSSSCDSIAFQLPPLDGCWWGGDRAGRQESSGAAAYWLQHHQSGILPGAKPSAAPPRLAFPFEMVYRSGGAPSTLHEDASTWTRHLKDCSSSSGGSSASCAPDDGCNDYEADPDYVPIRERLRERRAACAAAAHAKQDQPYHLYSPVSHVPSSAAGKQPCAARKGRKNATRKSKPRVVFPPEIKQRLDEALMDKFINPQDWRSPACAHQQYQTGRVNNKGDNIFSPSSLSPKFIELVNATGLTEKQVKQYMHNNARKGVRLAQLFHRNLIVKG